MAQKRNLEGGLKRGGMGVSPVHLFGQEARASINRKELFDELI